MLRDCRRLTFKQGIYGVVKFVTTIFYVGYLVE